MEELAAFAFDCWPDAASLSTYRGLQLRRRIGPTVMPYLQPLIWSAVVAPCAGRMAVAPAAIARYLTHTLTRRLTEGTPW